MAGSVFVDVCRFFPTTGGTTDWTFSSAVLGYQSPASAGIVNGALYSYRAESVDLTQWEIGQGAYNTGTGVLARTTVLYNSAGTGTGTGQSGAGTKINFSAAPQIGLVALREDLLTANITKTIQQTGTDNVSGVTSLRQQDHNSACKAFVFFTSAAPPVINSAYNVTSVSRTAAGIFVVNFTVPFSTVNYVCIATPQGTTATTDTAINNGAANTAGAATIVTLNIAGVPTDPSIGCHAAFFGTQ